MKLDRLNIEDLSLAVSCGERCEGEYVSRLVSLIMVAFDCGVPSITCACDECLEEQSQKALERLAGKNPILKLAGRDESVLLDEELGFFVLGRTSGFLVLRDAANEHKYSIYLSSIEANIDTASRCAYLITNILGFSSLLSFEVRFSIYELLNNIIEHGLEEEEQHWINIELEKKSEKLSVTIMDRGIKFDPTGDDYFDLEHYLDSGRTRGLGLILIRRLAERMNYRRESGYNKIFFEKSLTSGTSEGTPKEEGTMAQMIVGEPQRQADESYLIPLEGDLDTKGALVLEDLMNMLLEQKMHRVTLDFENVPFVSSAGVGILLGMVSALRDAGGDVMFANVTPKVRSVFRLLNLDDFFKIVDAPETVR
jgi:anti-sigma B factor antagonist